METPNYIVDAKGNVYAPFETDLVSGYIPVDLPKIKDPFLRWKGPKINVETEWYPATSFMFDFQKHEVMLRLFVTADQKQIVIRPLTQIYGTGMSVREDPTKEDREEIVALGLIDIGSVHSHCTAKAFASGIDTDDEKNWPGGLHMTVGNLDEPKYDLHCRFAWDMPGLEEGGKVIRKAQRTLQTPYLRDWFELPAHVALFLEEEEEIEKDIINYTLCKPVDAEYPDWWKSKLIDPPVRVQTWGHGQTMLDMTSGGESVYMKRAKGKGKRGNDIEDFHRRRWQAWQSCMAVLADYVEARTNKWTVDDFRPELRNKLFNLFPISKEILVKIQKEIERFNLTENDIFGAWNWGEISN